VRIQADHEPGIGKLSKLRADTTILESHSQSMPDKSIVLLHACAHNPTGIDPTREQWREISDLIKEKQHFPLIDNAYLGFASGSVDNDAFMLRHFVEEGHQLMLCQSFAKNMGLYGERVGTFSIVCADPLEKARVDSQIKMCVAELFRRADFAAYRPCRETDR
jgi:aspartate aminotransferase